MKTSLQLSFIIPKEYWWTQNRRGNWKKKYRHTSAVKDIARYTVRQWKHLHVDSYMLLRSWDKVHVTAVIRPIRRGRFDPENAAPMVKAVIDAMTLEQCWVDDDYTHLVGPDYRAGLRCDDGRYRVVLLVEQADE